MLKMCVNLCGADERGDDLESRKKKESARDLSIQSRDSRPQVSKSPSHSPPLWLDENLSPGQKYYMVSSSPERNLKNEIADVKKLPEVGTPDANITWDINNEILDESIFSAKRFYVSGEILAEPSPRNSSQHRSPEQASRRPPKRRGRMKRPFVPPLPREKMCRRFDWEPSLTSVQEVSP